MFEVWPDFAAFLLAISMVNSCWQLLRTIALEPSLLTIIIHQHSPRNMIANRCFFLFSTHYTSVLLPCCILMCVAIFFYSLGFVIMGLTNCYQICPFPALSQPKPTPCPAQGTIDHLPDVLPGDDLKHCECLIRPDSPGPWALFCSVRYLLSGE